MIVQGLLEHITIRCRRLFSNMKVRYEKAQKMAGVERKHATTLEEMAAHLERLKLSSSIVGVMKLLVREDAEEEAGLGVTIPDIGPVDGAHKDRYTFLQ